MPSGIDGVELVADRGDRGDRVARVLPPVRVGLRAVGGGEGGRGVDQRVDGGVGARALEDLIEPDVQIAAGAEDHVGIGERGGVARAGLVLVRVGVGGEDPVNVGAVAGDVADEIGDLRGRRAYRQAPVVGAVAASGKCNDHRNDEGQGGVRNGRVLER